MRWIRGVDTILASALVLLVTLGTITLTSLAASPELSISPDTLVTHGAAVVLGVLIVVILWGMDYRTIRGMSRPLYLITLVLLITVLILGETVQGSSRWIRLGGLNFQPVELAKIMVVILMAKYMATYQTHLSSFKYIVYSAIPIILLSGLTFLQPDLGSALILIAVWIAMLFMARIRWRHMMYLLGIVAVIGSVLWIGYLEPYQKERVYTFLEPYSEPLESGYTTVQSLRAIRRGGVFGQGLSQSGELRYVPEVHTDFIFAGFAQQWGFVGISLYFLLVSVVIGRLVSITFKTRDVFAQMLVGGVLALFVIQTAVNVGMNLGLLPVTGLPLPLMSYGGSSLISFAVLFGLVFSIYRQLAMTGSHIFARENQSDLI